MSLSESRVVEVYAPQDNLPRIAAIVLLLLLHAIVLAVLLTAKVTTVPVPRGMREIILSLVRTKPRALPPPKKPEEKVRVLSPAFRPLTLPPSITQQQPDITGVGNALFNCDPDSLAGMPPDQRGNCDHLVISKPGGAPDLGMPKKLEAHDEARWSAALAARHTPVRAPCVSMKEGPVPITGGKRDTIVMTDVLCAAKGLINGFGGPK